MRLWSLHPKYLDPRGLVALWRETLLARKVIQGISKGYRNHPQLERFKHHPDPLVAIEYYLQVIYEEAYRRNFRFDNGKIKKFPLNCQPISVSRGQINFEWIHLKDKLERRNLDFYNKLKEIRSEEILSHPLFIIIPGSIASWEKSDKAELANSG